MDYESDFTYPGMDVEVFELNYDRSRRRNMAVLIDTPIGLKKVRASQVSSDAHYLFIHDMLRQQRWIAISSIQRVDGIIYTCDQASGAAVALKPTVFLEEDL